MNDGLNAFTSSETVCYRVPVIKGQGGEADTKTLEAAKNKLLQAALDADLGYYTSEEEADRLALRWLAWLGINVENSYADWLTYAEAVDAFRQHSDFYFSFKKCIGLFEADPRWTEAGQAVPIPIGSFAERHHSSCFRAWLMERESGHWALPFGRKQKREVDPI